MPEWKTSDTKLILIQNSNRALPFFKILRANKQFVRTAEHEMAFQDPKEHIRTVTALEKPIPSETLFLYMNITEVVKCEQAIHFDRKELSRSIKNVSKH